MVKLLLVFFFTVDGFGCFNNFWPLYARWQAYTRPTVLKIRWEESYFEIFIHLSQVKSPLTKGVFGGAHLQCNTWRESVLHWRVLKLTLTLLFSVISGSFFQIFFWKIQMWNVNNIHLFCYTNYGFFNHFFTKTYTPSFIADPSQGHYKTRWTRMSRKISKWKVFRDHRR